MVFHGLSRALSSTPSFEKALRYTAENADFSCVEALNAPLIVSLIARRKSEGLPPVVMAVTATQRE